MKTMNLSAVGLLAIGAITASMAASVSWAKAADVDPLAVQTLQNMTAFMSELDGFRVHTDNTLEYLLDSGQRVDFDVSASVIIRRPNKLVTHRVGQESEQSFFYDGETLTLSMSSPSGTVYASSEAPETLEGMLDFARESLDLIIPVSDLVYRNAQSILMNGVTDAAYLGTTSIRDMTCHHLAFRRPDVDFQVWVLTGDLPLPCKYVVTDTSLPVPLSIVSEMSEWDLNPETADAEFEYSPSEKAQPIIFVPIESNAVAE